MSQGVHIPVPEAAGEGPLLDHLAPIRNLARTARRIDLGPFESQPLFEAERVLRPLLGRLLTVAISALDQLVVTLETIPLENTDDWFGCETENPAKGGDSDAAGLCVLARMEMARRLDQLRQHETGGDLWSFLICCNQVRGSLIRAATAVESAICRHTSQKPELNFPSDLESALRIRGEYLGFHTKVDLCGDPSPEQLHDRMLTVAAVMAGMIKSPNYHEFRTNDRFQLRKLETQITDWLAQGDQADSQTGIYLWQEISALSALFLEINNREELVQYDRGVVLTTLERLYLGGPLNADDQIRLHETLITTQGRDAELDDLVRANAPMDSGVFFRAVTRCAFRLEPGTAQRIVLGQSYSSNNFSKGQA